MAKVMFLQHIWFPLGAVMALSGSLKHAGHETALSVGDDEKVLKEIEDYNPDIIVISTITAFRRFMITISRKIREKGIKALIVGGGYDVSFFPRIINLAPIDAICIGEGDEALIELANAFDKKEDFSKIKNLWVKKDGKIIKNALRPFNDVNVKVPDDHDIYRDYDSYFSDIEFEQVMVGRGCPYRCSYCYNHAYRRMYEAVDRRYCTLREPASVIEECLKIQRRYRKVKNIFFNDSTLGYNKKWIRDFLRKYKESGVELPFTMNMCMNEIDEELCKALAATKKCFLIRVGMETGNERFRTTVLNKLQTTNEACIKATDLMKKYKIKYSLQVMLGLPGEKLEWAIETLDFAGRISDRNTVVAVNTFKPFPGLEITEYGVKIGEYRKELIEDSSLIGDNVMNIFNNFRVDEEGRQITNLRRLSQIYVHFPFLRALIKNRLIHYPDNIIYRKVQQYSDYYFTNRHHINASWGYLIRYALKHARKAGTIN